MVALNDVPKFTLEAKVHLLSLAPLAARCEPCCTGAPALYMGSRNLVPLKPCHRTYYTTESFPAAQRHLGIPRVWCSAESRNFSHARKIKSILDNLSCYLIQKVLHLVFPMEGYDGFSCGESAKRLLVGVTCGVTFP